MSESNYIKNVKKRINRETVKKIKGLYSKKFGWWTRRGRNKITPEQVGTPDVTDISEKTQKYSKEHMQMFEIKTNPAKAESWTKHTGPEQPLEDIIMDSNSPLPEGTEVKEECDNGSFDDGTVAEHQIPEAMEALEENMSSKISFDKDEHGIGFDHPISYPEMYHYKTTAVEIFEAQEAEAMELDEDTPKYNCPMSQNDHQHQELMLQNDQHQELISEETHVCMPSEELPEAYRDEPETEDGVRGNVGNSNQNENDEDPVTDYQFRDKIDRGENSGTTDFTQSQISEEMEEQTKNIGIIEKPITDSKVGKVINEGENSNSPIDTNSQVPERIEERRRNKRIRETLDVDLGPSAKRNKCARTQKPQSSVFQSECKKVKRKERRRQLRTLGPATSFRNQKTHASGFKSQEKDPRTFSDAERGKHVNVDNLTVNDDLLRTVMWALSFYGVIGYTWLSSSFAVQCVSIISISMTGFGVHYFLNVKYSTDIHDGNPAPSPKEAPKKSSVKECEETPPQFRDPYRPKKIHRWIYNQIYRYIPDSSDQFDLFCSFFKAYLCPTEMHSCKNIIDFLDKLESKGIISVGNYSALHDIKRFGIDHYIDEIINNPERCYDAAM